MTLTLFPAHVQRFILLLFVLAALALMSVKVRADEPVRYYLENGKLVAAKAAAPCVCGDSCKCAPGECPSKCPTPAAKKVAGKKLYWMGCECSAEQLAPILQAWPGSTRIETADGIDYRPPAAALEALMARTRPTGPVEIITPDGRTETRTVEGPASYGGSIECANGVCRLGSAGDCPGGVCQVGGVASSGGSRPSGSCGGVGYSGSYSSRTTTTQSYGAFAGRQPRLRIFGGPGLVRGFFGGRCR